MFLKDLFSFSKKEVNIEIVDFNNIIENKILMSNLRKLTLCPGSGMNFELDHLTKIAKLRKVNARVITAYRDGNMVGWALLSRERSEFQFSQTYDKFIPEKHGVLFEVFVDPKARRTGVASALLKKARKHAGPHTLCVAPWDNGSFKFYEKFNKYKQIKL
jgi:GNAT superfamily N-acetyltransferase